MKTIHLLGATLVAALAATTARAGQPSQAAHHPTSPAPTAAGAPAVDAASQGELASVPVAQRNDVITWKLVTNGPVPDTAASRSQYPPLSRAGRRSAPKGN